VKPPDKRKPGLGTRADADTYTTTARHLIPTDRVPVQLSLFGEHDNYPSDGMYPARAWAAAEWHLRLGANRMAYEREPRHWWAREAERRRAGAA
jgi:hypothetical protein